MAALVKEEIQPLLFAESLEREMHADRMQGRGRMRPAAKNGTPDSLEPLRLLPLIAGIAGQNPDHMAGPVACLEVSHQPDKLRLRQVIPRVFFSKAPRLDNGGKQTMRVDRIDTLVKAPVEPRIDAYLLHTREGDIAILVRGHPVTRRDSIEVNHREPFLLTI